MASVTDTLRCGIRAVKSPAQSWQSALPFRGESHDGVDRISGYGTPQIKI
jgi:hypothetical protein